jgi:hypothetical protein
LLDRNAMKATGFLLIESLITFKFLLIDLF